MWQEHKQYSDWSLYEGEKNIFNVIKLIKKMEKIKDYDDEGEKKVIKMLS